MAPARSGLVAPAALEGHLLPVGEKVASLSWLPSSGWGRSTTSNWYEILPPLSSSVVFTEIRVRVWVPAGLNELDAPFFKDDPAHDGAAYLLVADRSQVPLYLRPAPKLEGHPVREGGVLYAKPSVIRVEAEQDVGIAPLDGLAQGAEVQPPCCILFDHVPPFRLASPRDRLLYANAA